MELRSTKSPYENCWVYPSPKPIPAKFYIALIMQDPIKLEVAVFVSALVISTPAVSIHQTADLQRRQAVHQ